MGNETSHISPLVFCVNWTHVYCDIGNVASPRLMGQLGRDFNINILKVGRGFKINILGGGGTKSSAKSGTASPVRFKTGVIY